jgi:hypothetical protein
MLRPTFKLDMPHISLPHIIGTWWHVKCSFFMLLFFDVVVTHERGRNITQPVSRWLPTPAARVRAQVRSCEIFGSQNGNEAGFLRVLRFPQPILIPLSDPHSSSIVIKRRFLFTVWSVCRLKWFLAGSRNSLENVRKSQMVPDQVGLLRLWQKRLCSGCKRWFKLTGG